MDEFLFSAMDIPNEVQKLLNKVEDDVCNGMTDSERKAYLFGAENVLSALQALLELDEEPTVHVSGLNEIIEMDITELEEIFLK